MIELMNIPVDAISANPDQPRKLFDRGELEGLAQSINDEGLIHPIKVVERQDGYTLVDGERRWRAVQLLGWKSIDAIVHPYNEVAGINKFVQAAVANLQRVDLNPIEEGEVYERLHEEGMTINQISRLAGKSFGHVNLRLKMMEFEPEIRELFAERRLPIDQSVVYGIFNLPEERRVSLARRFVLNGSTASGIKQALSRIMNAQAAGGAVMKRGKRGPAEQLSDENPVKVNPLLRALERDGAMPQWALIAQAARETCEHCDLYEMASASVCRNCPAVELLKRINDMVKKAGEDETK